MHNEFQGGINNHRTHVMKFLRTYFHVHTVTAQNSVHLDDDVKQILESLIFHLNHGSEMKELYDKHNELSNIVEQRIISIYDSETTNALSSSMNTTLARMVALRMIEVPMKITSFLFNELYFYDYMGNCIRTHTPEPQPNDEFINTTKPKILQLFEMRKKMLDIAKKVYQHAEFDEWASMTEHSMVALQQLAREFDRGASFLGIDLIDFDLKNNFPVVDQIDAKLAEVGKYYRNEHIEKIGMLTSCYRHDVKTLGLCLREPGVFKAIAE